MLDGYVHGAMCKPLALSSVENDFDVDVASHYDLLKFLSYLLSGLSGYDVVKKLYGKNAVNKYAKFDKDMTWTGLRTTYQKEHTLGELQDKYFEDSTYPESGDLGNSPVIHHRKFKFEKRNTGHQ